MKFEISFLPTPRNLSFIQPQEAEIIQVDPARIRKLDLILTPSNLNSLIQECQAGRQDRLSTRNSGDGGGDQLSLPTTDREDQGSLFQITGTTIYKAVCPSVCLFVSNPSNQLILKIYSLKSVN